MAIVTDVLRSGRAESVSLSISSGGTPTKDIIEATLLKEGKKVISANQTVNGAGTKLLMYLKT